MAAVAIASVAAAPAASADTILPVPGSEPADQAIAQLKSLGYNVSINWLEGHPDVPLSECQVTGITGLPAPTKSTDATTTPTFNTVYVDVACPNAK